MKHYIFGYGSLVNQEALHQYLDRECSTDAFTLCQLKGYRRCWNVAMDNRIDLPSYKYYLDAATGERPEVFVTFLNIRPARQGLLTGALFEVSMDELLIIDQRERNYHRVVVTHQIDCQVSGAVWAYIGTPEAERRYQQGLASRTACIAEEYYHFVRECFYCHGDTIGQSYHEATDLPEVPLRKLVRMDL